MNKGKLFQSTIVAALAGFIFGFDMVVISGADKPIQELWHTTPLWSSSTKRMKANHWFFSSISFRRSVQVHGHERDCIIPLLLHLPKFLYFCG